MKDMAATKEKEIYEGLTVEQAQELLATTKEALVLCIGNIAVAGRVYHSGTIVAAAQIDPEVLSEPVSPAHPHLMKAYTLAEGLEMLKDARRTWDGQRQPQKDQVLTLKDEVARLLPTWTAPYF